MSWHSFGCDSMPCLFSCECCLPVVQRCLTCHYCILALYKQEHVRGASCNQHASDGCIAAMICDVCILVRMQRCKPLMCAVWFRARAHAWSDKSSAASGRACSYSAAFPNSQLAFTAMRARNNAIMPNCCANASPPAVHNVIPSCQFHRHDFVYLNHIVHSPATQSFFAEWGTLGEPRLRSSLHARLQTSSAQ